MTIGNPAFKTGSEMTLMSSPTYRISGLERGDKIASELLGRRMDEWKTAAVILGEPSRDRACKWEREEGVVFGDDFHVVSILRDLQMNSSSKSSLLEHRSSWEGGTSGSASYTQHARTRSQVGIEQKRA